MPAVLLGLGVETTLLDCIKHGTFPDTEQVAGAELTPSLLSSLQTGLREARSDVESQLRRTSNEAAPDIDGWITQAKQVQADIERSKETAREIVQEAEANKFLKSRAEDANAKVGLLQTEVAFHEALIQALTSLSRASCLITDAKFQISSGQLAPALSLLSNVEETLAGLQQYASTRAYELVDTRLATAKAALVEKAIASAKDLIRIDTSEQSLRIAKDMQTITVSTVVEILTSLQAFDPWLERLQHRVHRTILEAILQAGVTRRAYQLSLSGDICQLQSLPDQDYQILQLIDHVDRLAVFLNKTLPEAISVPLARSMMPRFLQKFETTCLTPSVPVEPDKLPQLDGLLDRVRRLAANLQSMGWPGHENLTAWIDDAPRVWLSRQREHALERVRQSLMGNLQQRKTVELTTMHTAPEDDTMVEAWDEKWSDDESKTPVSATNVQETDDMDYVSAWEVDDDAETGEAVDGEAWGWDEEDKTKSKDQDRSPSKATNRQTESRRPSVQKEPMTVTAVPEAIFDIVTDILNTASVLSDELYAASPVSSAVSALYNLPTLVLAMYRATATSVYSRIVTGNMLIFNDTIWLEDRLQSLLDGASGQSSLGTNIRQRLANEMKSLDTFCRRAYELELDSQRTVLSDLLDGAQGFTNCTAYPLSQACDSAVQTTVARLRTVHAEWALVLSGTVCLQSTGSLLATMTGKFTSDVLDQSDIGEDESKRLKKYSDEISSLRDLFALDTDQDQTGIYCSNWLRFQYLGEILESNLADIKYLWTEGELALEFDCDEVVDLIQALFADSDHRRKAIAEIRRSART